MKKRNTIEKNGGFAFHPRPHFTEESDCFASEQASKSLVLLRLMVKESWGFM